MRILFLIFIILSILGSSVAISVSFSLSRKIKELRDDASRIKQSAENEMESVNTRLEKLEKGIAPDYEQAKAAAGASKGWWGAAAMRTSARGRRIRNAGTPPP